MMMDAKREMSKIVKKRRGSQPQEDKLVVQDNILERLQKKITKISK